MRAWADLVWAGAAVIAFAACGGSTSDSGSTHSGGSGGSHTGGAGSGGTNLGGAGSGGTASGGTAGCGGGGAIDCVDPCTGQMSSPACVNGAWTCNTTPCVDGGQCPTGQVPTVGGCLSCTDAITAFEAAIDAARKQNAACNTEADCVMTAAGTTCAGACPIAVAKSGEAAFAAALAQIDADYCSGFVPECGYSTPKCAQATLVCNAGSCEATYN